MTSMLGFWRRSCRMRSTSASSAKAKVGRSSKLTARNDGDKCTTALQDLVTIRAAHGPEESVGCLRLQCIAGG